MFKEVHVAFGNPIFQYHNIPNSHIEIYENGNGKVDENGKVNESSCVLKRVLNNERYSSQI